MAEVVSHRFDSWLAGAAGRARPRAERGSALVEVLVGTLVLTLATTAVLSGLDGAQDAGRRNKDRSVAATLAQQDLERMRSMPPTVLSNYEEVRTVTVAGVDYTVASGTEWVVDASGLLSCTSEETEAEYLQLTSTVTAPASAEDPVTAESLLTPPPGSFADDTGTAAVKLTDRDGAPHEGISVALTGPGSAADTTNELGCAIFGQVETGTWTAQAGGGLVGWDGLSPAQSPVTVATGITSLTQMEVDAPASLRALFETPSEEPALWHSISVTNAKLPGGARHFADTTATASKDAESLFPFKDGYGVYATTCEDGVEGPLCCEASNPAIWSADYFETSDKGHVELDPGDLLEPVDVVLPTLSVTVRRDDGSPFTSAQVTVTQLDSDYDSEPGSNECSSTVADVPASGDETTTSYLFQIPVPFGHYSVCATDGTRRVQTDPSTPPLDPDLTTDPLEQSIELVVPTSGGTGTCP